MSDSGVLTEYQLTTAVKSLCSLVNDTHDKVVCSKVFRCLAVQSLPLHIVTAQVSTFFTLEQVKVSEVCHPGLT